MKSLVYIDEIIENPKNAKRATKLNRTYEKAVQTIDGNGKKLSVEGKTVLIEKKGEKYTFTIGGKPVAEDVRRMLSDEFDRTEGKDVRDVMFPRMAVKPGESWKIDGDEMAKAIGDKGPIFARDKVTATGTLVKTYKQDGKQFGVIEFAFDAPITSLGPKNPVTIKDGTMSMKLSGDGCIDGTVLDGQIDHEDGADDERLHPGHRPESRGREHREPDGGSAAEQVTASRIGVCNRVAWECPNCRQSIDP